MYGLFSLQPPTKKFAVVNVKFHSVFIKARVSFVPVCQVSEISKLWSHHA